MKKTKKLLFTLIVTTAFFISTNVFAEGSDGVSLTIKYHVNGGNTIPDKLVCTDDGCNDVMNKLQAIELPTPTREGYTFKGWYQEESLTNPVFDYAHPTGDIGSIALGDGANYFNYYAKWEKITTGASGTTPSGSSTSEPNTQGSNTPEEGSTSASTEMYLSLIIDDDNKKEIKICSINDNCTDQSIFETKLKKINLPIPEKEGYKFEGWYLDEKYTTKIKNTTEVFEAINKTKIKTDGTVFTEDGSAPIGMSISGSGNLEEQYEKVSFKLYAKWTKDGKQVVKTDKQVVKTGNTGMNSGMLFTIIGILMISAGSVVIYKKTRNNN